MTQYDDVPAAYARRVVPRYVPIAQLVVDRCTESLASAPAVVEVAAGTGLLTGLLEPGLPEGSTYVATDISAAMLRLARARPGADRIPHVCADAFAMPFPDATTDLVVSSLGPMQEDVRALSEALRLLTPGGHLVLSMWGTGYSELAMLQVARHRLGLGVWAAAPVEAATARCAEAGFVGVSTTSFRLDVSHPSVADYLAYRRSFGWPPWLPEGREEEWMSAVEAAVAAYVGPRGTVDLDWTIVLLEGRRPGGADLVSPPEPTGPDTTARPAL